LALPFLRPTPISSSYYTECSALASIKPTAELIVRIAGNTGRLELLIDGKPKPFRANAPPPPPGTPTATTPEPQQQQHDAKKRRVSSGGKGKSSAAAAAAVSFGAIDLIVPPTLEVYPILRFPPMFTGTATLGGVGGVGVSTRAQRAKARAVIARAAACGPETANRLALQAVAVNDLVLLKETLDATKQVADPNRSRAPDDPMTAFSLAALTNNLEAMRVIGSTLFTHGHKRVAAPSNSIAAEAGTGSVSRYSYNHAIGKVRW